MSLRGRLLLSGPRPGAWNMALDEALLDCAEEDVVTLRLYSWTPVTISLGYFQKRGTVPDAFRERFPLVRRSTGGGAIVHTPHEVTISLTGKARARAPSPEATVERLVEGLQAALEPLGIRPRLAGCGSCGEPGETSAVGARVHAFLCGAIRRPLDVVADLPSGGAVKILGSAQRRRGRAWLVHGSLPIANPRSVFPEGAFPEGESFGLEELIPKKGPGPDVENLPYSSLRDAVVLNLPPGLSRALGVEFEPSAATPAELKLANRLVATRHAAPEWIDREAGSSEEVSPRDGRARRRLVE